MAHRVRDILVMVVATMGVCASPATAQFVGQRRLGLTSAQAPGTSWPAPTLALPTRVDLPETYWKEGALVGGVIGFFVANILLEKGSSAGRRFALGAVGAAVFAMPGALFGGLARKGDTSSPELERRTVSPGEDRERPGR
jgi:hypothetical protein